MNLYLAGFQGVGKTYFGVRLAERLGVPFVDTDVTFLELEGGNQTTVRDLYTTLGKEGFRKKEEKVIAVIGKRKNSVVALGGGSLESLFNQRIVRATGKLVYLFLPEEKLQKMVEERISRNDIPGYLDVHAPIDSFSRLFATRHPIFAAQADIIIDLEKKNNSEVLELLEDLWHKMDVKMIDEVNDGKQ